MKGGSLIMLISFLSATKGKAESIAGLHPPPIVYPFGGTFKLVVGFAVPVELPGRTLVYGQNFQFQYPLPQNATFFTDFFGDSSRERNRRDVPLVNDRQVIYEYFEAEFQRAGPAEKDCLKRSICEASKDPLEEEGLVGEILHLLLTPDYGAETWVNVDYLRAAQTGRRYHDCTAHYPSCTAVHGILHRISTLINAPT